MTENPGERPSLGRALGETSRLIGKLHHRALADYETDFPTWMLLTLLAETSGPMPVDDVAAELGRRMDLAAPEALRVIERAAVAGHVVHRGESDSATAELSEEGRAHFAALYAFSRETTDVAFQGIDPEDVDAALRVLQIAGKQAVAALG